MFTNIEIERLRRQMSKTEFSALLAVSTGTLNAWVNGRRGIPADKLRAMSRLLGCSVDYLLQNSEPIRNTHERR